MCVTMVQWSRSSLPVQINRVRLPATLLSVSLYRFFFPVWSIFFHTIFSFFLYSYFRPCWSCTWINIYFKLKSGGLFWKRDTKTLDLRAYWPSLRPDKKHKLSRHVPPLKQVNFFSMSVDIMTQTHSTPQSVLIYSQHPQAKVKLAFCTAS